MTTLADQRRTFRDWVIIGFPAVAGAGSIIGAFDSAWRTWHTQGRAGTYFSSEMGILVGLFLVGLAFKAHQRDLRAYVSVVIPLVILFLAAAIELILRPSLGFGGLAAGVAIALLNAVAGLRAQLGIRSQQALA